MENILPYHKRQGDLVLSLRFVTPSQERAREVKTDLNLDASEDAHVETAIENYSFKDSVYAVYAAESHPDQFPRGWDRNLSGDNVVLVDSVLNTFRGIKQEWEDRNRPLNFYKRPQPELIAEAFDRVRWCQDVSTVGGELMSNLILKHALPNANHRTAVAYVRTYLQSVTDDPRTEFEHAGDYQGEWHDWARKHVYESKRLLMLRRKEGLFRHAKQFGVTTVRRKSGVKIDLTAHDFESGNMRSMAEEGHKNRCVQFVKDVLTRSGYEELIKRNDDGKRAFVDRLR